MKKKLLIAAGVLLAAAAAVAGLFFVLRMNREPAKVYSVELLSTSAEGMGMESTYGTVTMDRMQTVYLSETQTVTEILVSQGQTVKAGDPLLRFDTTLSQLSLERKALEIRQLERELEKEKAEYNKLAGKTVYTAAIPGEPGVRLTLLSFPRTYIEFEDVPEESSTETTESTEPEEPQESGEEPTEDTGETTAPTLDPSIGIPVEGPVAPGEAYIIHGHRIAAGSGTQSDPYLVGIVSGFEFCELNVEELLRDKNSAYVVFCECDLNRIDRPAVTAWGLLFLRDCDSWKFRLFDASAYVGQPLVISPYTYFDQDPEETEPPDNGGSGDGDRKARMEELKRSIAENELALRVKNLEYRKMERELGDGVIYADFDGTVLTVNDPDEAYQNNLPVLKLSGGGGYYIRGTISELRLNSIFVGQSVEVTSWQTYETYMGTISEISDVPTTDDFWYDGNANASYYAFYVVLSDDVDLEEGSMAELRLVQEEGASGFYLQDAFFLQENGKNYVFVRGENGLLEKREVVTGGKLWGQYTEILSGLTREDFIAFPYAKSTEEGAKTAEGTEGELYGWG